MLMIMSPEEVRQNRKREAESFGRGSSNDKLNFDKINAIPSPMMATFFGGDEWPIYDIEVQTATVRIDVCGMLQVKSFGEIKSLKDIDGYDHDPEDFWKD